MPMRETLLIVLFFFLKIRSYYLSPISEQRFLRTHICPFFRCFNIVYYYFPSQNLFRKENIQISCWRFFLCPETAHDAQSSKACKVNGFFYDTCIG